MEVGQVFVSSSGSKLKILEDMGSSVLVEFIDTVQPFRKVLKKKSVKRRSFRGPYCRTVFGVGYLGEGPFKVSYRAANGKYFQTKEYLKWAGMLKRCYDPGYLSKQPSYQGAEVCEEWHNFQNFAEWAVKQRNFGLDGFELDKDLTESSNGVYCPENCAFVPKLINRVMAQRGKKGKWVEGVEKNSKGSRFFARLGRFGKSERVGTAESEEAAYAIFKKAKEDYIHSLAEKYKHCLDEKTYMFLISHKQPTYEEAVDRWERLNGPRHVLPTAKDLEDK